MILQRSMQILATTVLCAVNISASQTTFTRITDTTNPIVTDTPPQGYAGCSWVDYDNDGNLDLYVNPNYLYRNLGNGNFSRVPTIIGATQPLTGTIIGSGNSWADYDNDGRLDVFVASGKSFLFHNEGSGQFSKIITGAIGDSIANRGWTCAWGDFDQDGYVDLVIVHPAGFVPLTPIPNIMLHNDGPPNYTFSRIDTGAIVTGLAPYTVGSWADYDLDGDLDFFIGCGPATSTPLPDHLYRNMKRETGTAFFTRITTNPIATDPADGQNWNWIDYDNDGDLDGFRTNYGGSGSLAMRQNNLYRNDGGTYVKVTTGAIVTDQFISLANVWGDFDNDGDLDCFVTNESAHNSYYQNNGDGTFTSILAGDLVTNVGSHSGAAAGDYDNDGDIDLMVIAPQSSAKALYRNDLGNGYSWVNILCIGTTSDKAAIGTKIRAKAMINGSAVWQMSEVSAQNSFNGHNMLNVHFGFRDATTIDSLVLDWPRGLHQVFTNVAPNLRYRATEGQGLVSLTSAKDDHEVIGSAFWLEQNYPNPFNPTTNIRFNLPASAFVLLKVYDVLGREVATVVNERMEAGNHVRSFDANGLSSGVFVYRLTTGDRSLSQRMLLLK